MVNKPFTAYRSPDITRQAHVRQCCRQPRPSCRLHPDVIKQLVRSRDTGGLDDLDHRARIDRVKLQDLGARNLQRVLDGNGSATPARRDDSDVRVHLLAELGESLDLTGIHMRVVDDHGRRPQAAKVVRNLPSVIIDLEQRLPLQDQRTQQKRLARPRRTYQKAVAWAFLKPARLALAPENPVAEDRPSRDRERTQRAWPPRHLQQALTPGWVPIQALRKPVLVVDLQKRHVELARLCLQLLPHAWRHAPRGREERPVHRLLVALCAHQISAQVPGQVLPRRDDERGRIPPTAICERAVEPAISTSGDKNKPGPIWLEQFDGTSLEDSRIQCTVQRLDNCPVV